MSAKSELTRSFATSFSNVIDSGANALKAYSNSQFNRITTQVTDDYNAFIEELQFDNDFEHYQDKVDAFWAQEDAKIQGGGYGALATSKYMDEARTSYYNRMSTSAKEMMVDGMWTQTKANYDLACRNIIADTSRTYDEKIAAIEKEYESDGMASYPVKLGIATKPEQYKETIKGASIEQAFSERYVNAYADKYYQDGMSVDQIFKEMKGSSGISEWSTVDEDNAKAYIQNSLKNIGAERQTTATNAQTEIVSKFTTKYLNGEDYTAQDVINEAINSGAIREDGSVDRFWTTFLTPYIEYAVKEEELATETAKAQAELETIGEKTEEDILGVLAAVNDGSYQFTPQVGETPEVKGVNTKIPIPTGSDPEEISVATESKPAGNLKISETMSTDSEGNLTFKDQQTEVKAFKSNTGDVWAYSQTEIPGLEEYIFTDNRAEGKGILYRLEKGTDSPAFEKDYTPEKGSGNQLSDTIAATLSVTEGTEFEGAFTSDFDLTSSRLQGKHKYQCEGMEDLTIEYEPAVIALCDSWGITYDDKSPQTYKVAQIVQSLADKGAFSNPNKAVAVQHLANMRLNPEITPDEYNAQLLQYKTTGVLSDQEIKDYDLGKSAFAGDFGNSAVKGYLSMAYGRAFKNAFGKTLSDKAQNGLTPEQQNSWFNLKYQIEQELTRAVQLQPQRAQSNPVELVNDIVDTMTQKAFSDSLYSALTKMSSRPNVSAIDLKNFKGPNLANFNLYDIFNPQNYQMGIVSARRMDETKTGSEILSDYYGSMFSDERSKYQGMLNEDVIRFYNNAQTSTTDSRYYTSKSDAEAEINDLAKNVYKTDYASLTIPQKNELLFSYLVARSQMELKKSACNTFGYDMNDAYGNIVVAPSGGYGGGAAVVTNDGRVFISGGDPDNNGHKWMIGSVSGNTLENIRKGVSVISFEEISQNGLMSFSDDNLQFTKEGVNLNRENMRERKDKTYELTGIYDSVQPGRYNIKRSM